ncbi:hypothetical protein PINS_up004996 [Pythium insidiosum]|nr:hypothetical protein PINS_up004996 [Pythium insidiosum]
MDEATQVQALDALINLVRSSCGNVEACLSFGLQNEILVFLKERGLFADPSVSNQVLKKILRLFLYLANHSVSSEDIRSMLAVFRSPRMLHEDPDDQAVSYYVSTLEMIARDSFGPSSFFDMSGDYSGLILPVMESFPSTGYTFCAWLKFELLPETAAPLFMFCGKTDVGIMCSFVRSALAITCFDKKRNDSHVEIPDLITPGRWHFLSIVHTHRQIRGSKLDVYLNAELRHSTKLTYPNTTFMTPVVKSYVAMRDPTRGPSLRVLLGPLAMFGQPLPSNIISNVKSADEYDALVFQFNSYISSSTSAAPTSTGSTQPSASGAEGLLFAYDARNCDRTKGLCFDSSGNDNHAEAASTGVRLRQAGTFKQSMAQIGGPLVCLPLLVTSVNPSSSGSQTPSATTGVLDKAITAQFDEDSEFLGQMSDMVAKPLGVRAIPKVLMLIAEIMRHSLVNKFIFRRHQGVRLTALLLRCLPPNYLTSDLLVAIERFRSAVVSDRILADEIYKFLLFNFRIWVNAPTDLQLGIFDKLEEVTRKDASTSSAVSTRHFLRCLSWIYWKTPNDLSLRRAREYTTEELDMLRRKLLTIIKLELCESQPMKSSVIGRGSKAKEVKTQLSYESTRSLIFSMIGKPTNPTTSGLNADGTPSLQDAGDDKKSTPEDPDGGSVVESVPEADLPDLIELLIELSLQPTAPAGLLDLFGRLGGLRIWLPLLNFSSNTLRVMTLRLLRTYLTLKCQCVQDREKVMSPDKIQLSMGDSFLILSALNAAGHPMTIGVYSEVLLLILGMQVNEEEMKAPGSISEDYEALMDETVLSKSMIWHTYMMFPFLELIRASSPSIRLIAIRHLKVLFASSTPASSINRNMLIYNSISTNGALTISSTTEQTPIIEAILSLRGSERGLSVRRQLPTELFGITLEGCTGIPLSRLREQFLNPAAGEASRINALYSIMLADDTEFVMSLFAVHSENERKKSINGIAFRDMPNRIKVAAFEMMTHLQPAECAEFITQTAYELISSIICMEAKTNDMSWILLQDPFTSLSRFIESPDELEVVVMTLIKATLDKLNELLSVEINLRGKDDMPSRDSVLWRNAENIATLAAAVVLHYDPDTLGDVNPGALDLSDALPNSIYWKCERMLWHEAEIVDSLLGIWQHFASTFHSERDASFGRRSSRSIGISSIGAGRMSESGNQSPPPVGRRDSKNGSNRGIGFGFNLLAPPGSQGSSQASVVMRPHPGGPMRQVLQLLLRSFYIVLSSEDRSSESPSSEDQSRLKRDAGSMFLSRIHKLEYFVNAMGLGRDTTQYESSFTPSRSSTAANIGIGGLVSVSTLVRAAPGDETSLVLWFVPELAVLINRVRRKLWSDCAVKLASVLAGLVSKPLRSSEELVSLLNQADFASNNQEVGRRDGFYFEQMAHARESRATRRSAMLAHEVDEKARAKAELDRISRSTRTQVITERSDRTLQPEGGDDEKGSQVWLQRVKAKDIDDWMKLRVLLKWGVRHVWASTDAISWEDDESSSVNVNGLREALRKNEFWRLDSYTSSNWIRCRLLPDTDDTLSDYTEYVKSIATANERGVSPESTMDTMSVATADAIQPATEDDARQGGDGVDEGEDDEEFYDAEEAISSVMSGFGGDDVDANDLSPESGRLSTDASSTRSAIGIMGGTRGSVSGPSSARSYASQPLESPVVTTLPAEPDEPGSGRSQSLVDAADVADSVRAASRDTFSRIGAFSSRLSSGIKMLSGSARSSRVGEEDKAAAEAAAAGAPRLWRSKSGPTPTSTNGAPAGSETASSDNPTHQNEADDSSQSKEAEKPIQDKPQPSTCATNSRALRAPQSRSEQWKSLSALYRTKAYLVLPSGLMVYGLLRIGTTTIVFEGDYVTTLNKLSELTDDCVVEANLGGSFVSELKRRVWGVRVIRVIHRRRFLLNSHNGLELYFVDGSSCFFGFEGEDEAELVYAVLKERKPPCLAKWGKRLLAADRMFGRCKWTDMWVRREISNFEYLMLLNVAAGRSYNDLTQYPIFPWIIRDFESEELRLDDPTFFRDLSKPIGTQSPRGRETATRTYQSCRTDSRIPPYHFATSLSHMQSVFYYLCRQAPFTSAPVIDGKTVDAWLAGGVFESVSDAFQRATSEEGYHFELTPEFFYLPDFLVSDRNKQLVKGLRDDQTSSPVFAKLRQNVQLPRWANSPQDFIRQHRLALECDYVSENLHHWIDLTFGHKLMGQGATDSLNSFHIACHPEKLDLKSLNVGARARLTQRGTLPLQLFKKPHPARLTQDESLEARYPASHAVAALSSRRQVRRHDLGSRHSAPVVSIRFASVLISNVGLGGTGLGSGAGIGAHNSGDHGVVVYSCDSEGVVFAKRYLNSVPDQPKLSPFSFTELDQWWKLPAGSLVRDGVVFYEQMISCGYWDGSWRIHWSADGELLQRIAFHKKPILCMAHSEDAFTGDLALAFGSEDCTVSVWALSKLAASRSRRMFVKKEPPVGGLPWVLLHGHSHPVVAVSLNVDLDIVVSSSKDNTILVHSLRSATPLHNVEISSPVMSTVTHLSISHHGDMLIHGVMNRQSASATTDGSDVSEVVSQASGVAEQSEVYIVSMNGQLVSHDMLRTADGAPQVLLDRGVFFTKSGEYIITATGGVDGVIEVRPSRLPGTVARRIECKRTSNLTSVGMSHDERCVLCGYADGSIEAYAVPYGVEDGCKNQHGLDRKAREEEAEALAKADRRDQLRKEAEERRLKWGVGTGNQHSGLWIRGGKIDMPLEPYQSTMQGYYALLKQPCVTDDPSYEELLKNMWNAMYTRDSAAGMAFERSGPSWSRLGFQRPDPTTDFRAGGMLSLKCLVYFAENYYEHASRMVEHQVPGSRSNTYPWGPAGINITCMLARTFWSVDGCLYKERQYNWPFFADKSALYIMFSEVFLLFDHLWDEMNAHYGIFSEVMQSTTGVVLEALDEAKGDLQTFLVEIRAQSLTNSGRFRNGRAASRSMEEFLVNMSSNIVGAAPQSGTGSAPTGSSMHSSAPSGDTAKSPVASKVADLISLLSPPRSSANSTAFGGLATPSLFDLNADDPFANNDLRGCETPPLQDDDATAANDDPFAGLP